MSTVDALGAPPPIDLDGAGPDGGAATLAVLLSPAVRIEPELIRAVRLAVAPAIDVGAEADLWFSDWVAVRAADAVILRPEVIASLRQRLSTWIGASPATDPVHRVGEVMARTHAAISPALRLEEHVTWLAILGGAGGTEQSASSRAAIEEALRPALYSLIEEGRDGIAQWFGAAWPRLPEAVRSTVAAWQLAQVATQRLPMGAQFGPPASLADLTVFDASAVAASVGVLRVGVRRDGSTLVLGAAAGAGVAAVEAPATVPRLIDVSWTADGHPYTQTVALDGQEVRRLAVGHGAVRLRTGVGTYELPALGPPVRRPETVPTQRWSFGPPTGRGLRAFLAGLTAPWRAPRLSDVLEPLVTAHRTVHPRADVTLLQHAYDVASRCHSGQLRKSGDPYVTHSLAVAAILANLGMDTTTLAAALLHGTTARTPYTSDELRAEFGPDIALLVAGVTRLNGLERAESEPAETARRTIVSLVTDPRVLVIALADRLHNLRTLAFLPPADRERAAREALELLAPLAHRLGMNTVRWELEDLAFAALYPKRFDEIRRLVAEHAPQRDSLVGVVTRQLGSQLRAARITAQVTGRPKHAYSIYQKMIARVRDFAEVYDLVGVRVLVDTVRDCYATLGVIHANWPPLPGRFKDYITSPKFNMYQSLHTTVIGPNGKPLELQIRTYAMHRTAEYGIAAHWRYLETRAAIVGPPAHIDDLSWLRQLLDWVGDAADPVEYLHTLRFDAGGREIFAHTPKGDAVALPVDATPVDFAYAVHTEVGHRCMGARVNGRLVPLERRLANGDVVEILTSMSPSAGPSRDWLAFVRSPRARAGIRQFFANEGREPTIESGVEALVKAARKQGLPVQRILTQPTLMTVVRELHLPDLSALYAAVGDNQVPAQSVVARVVALLGGVEGIAEDVAELVVPRRRARPPQRSDHTGVVIAGQPDADVRLARCCNPVPGDDIAAFHVGYHMVSVHRAECAKADPLRERPERAVEAAWRQRPDSAFVVVVSVAMRDEPQLLTRVTSALSDHNVSIAWARWAADGSGTTTGRFKLVLAEPRHLDHILRTLGRIDGVTTARRIIDDE